MNDELISKQKILNTLKEWQSEDLPHTMYGDGYEDAVSDIIKLIETEVPVGAETKVMNDDLISRQAAIDIFDDYNIAVENGKIESYRRYREQLSNLPSVQPPKTGRWIPVKPLLTAARCSECKHAFADKTNYCPNCGTKMESEVLSDD